VQADPKACQPGETPLECEWRIQNPSIAIINLETWLVDGTVDRYESYLRRIVEFSIQHGTLPILITKADMAESKVPVINPAMARIAYEYDIPIVNFWHAAQFLDNHGLDPSREGFHLSTAGYDLKQKLTLFTLYDIWKAERPDLRVSAQPTEPVPVTTTAQPETTTLPAVKFQCAANCLYFDLFTSSPDGLMPAGIREVDMESKTIAELSSTPLVLQDILTSAGQVWMLVSEGSNLYLVDRSTGEVRLLLDNLYINGTQSAYFVSGGTMVIALSEQDSSRQIVQYDLRTDMKTIIPVNAAPPIHLIPNRDAGAVYWESGECPTFWILQAGWNLEDQPHQRTNGADQRQGKTGLLTAG